MLTFSEIHQKIFDQLSIEDLPKELEPLLQSISSTANSVVDWENALSIKCCRAAGVTKEVCLGLKDLGTKALQAKKLQEALVKYTNFIRQSHRLPVSGEESKERSKLVGQGYLSRSMVFYRVESYQHCIDDVEAALHYLGSSGHHDDDYILLDRKAKCLMASNGDPSHTMDLFSQALEAAAYSSTIPEMMKTAFQKQVKANMEKLSKETKDANDTNDLTTSAYDINLNKRHGKHPSMSNKLSINFSPGRGRYITASEDILAGEVVVMEDPSIMWSHFDLKTDSSKACYHCMGSLCHYMAYYSPLVDGLAFCSWRCLKQAMETYHIYEQFILEDYFNTIRESKQTLEQSGTLFLAYKALVRHPADYFVRNKERLLVSDPKFVMEEENDLDQSDRIVKSLYNMVTHDDQCSMEDRVKTAIRSAVLVNCMKTSGYLCLDKQPDRLDFFMQLLYHMQMAMAHSVLLVYRVEGALDANVPLTVVGSAIYDDIILMNHSCAANTTRFYQDGKAILVSKRDIVKGEEVTLTYGIHHHNMAKEKRSDTLKTGYKFDCECLACANDYPTLNNLSKSLGQSGKSLGKKLEKFLNQYKQSFADGRLLDAKNACNKYLRCLSNSGVKYPHANFEIGAIALNSCWWGIISANQMQSQTL